MSENEEDYVYAKNGLLIADKGEYRIVEVNRPHWGPRKYIKGNGRYKTSHSAKYLICLAEYKGAEWIANEMYRTTDGSIPIKIMRQMIELTGGIPNGRILDFGCGTGGASIHLAKNSDRCTVIGIDVDEKKINCANILLKDLHLDKRVKFIYEKDTTKLPFPGAYFDLIVVPAVIEHIEPKMRSRIIKELDRVLKRAGRLVIQGTPNRLYPFDFHTSQLFLVPYLPDSIAYWYIRHFSKRIKRENPEISWHQLLVKGVRGSTYWAIKRYLPDMELMDTNDYARIFKSDFLPNNPLKKYFSLPYYLIYKTICRTFKVPLSAFLKDLQFVLRKK